MGICIVVVGVDNEKYCQANNQTSPYTTIYYQDFGCGIVFRHPGCMDNRVLLCTKDSMYVLRL